jgi:hypothetical protein
MGQTQAKIMVKEEASVTSLESANASALERMSESGNQ